MMELLSILPFLFALAAAAPSDVKVLESPESCVLYKSQYDIITIVVPLNVINYYRDESSHLQGYSESIFFFVEADVDADGKRAYKGLYIFKKNKVTKLLEKGTGAAAASDGTTQVFLAALDGLYIYEIETNEAVKYGTLSDSIIDIAKPKENDVIYILTVDHELYKVTDMGNKKTKIDEVVNAQQIVLDYRNNIYYYTQDNQPYVFTTEGVKRNFSSLPHDVSNVLLLKPPYNIDNGVLFLENSAVYIIYEDGKSVLIDDKFRGDAKITAYGLEGTLVLYFAYNKKIYEYNFFPKINDMGFYLKDKGGIIRELSNQMSKSLYKN